MSLSTMRYLILLIPIVMIATPASAEIYKWTDENGHVNYSDSKPENHEVTEIEVPISTYESVTYGSVSHDKSTVDTGKKVVIFSATWCGSCKKAKKYFRRNGIPFTEYDIERGNKAKQLYKQLDATGVPVILVGNKRMNGFTEAGFERIYK
jgi:glutaredoxin